MLVGGGCCGGGAFARYHSSLASRALLFHPSMQHWWRRGAPRADVFTRVSVHYDSFIRFATRADVIALGSFSFASVLGVYLFNIVPAARALVFTSSGRTIEVVSASSAKIPRAPA